MLVAGPRYVPLMLDQPGVGHLIVGEGYAVDPAMLCKLDELESVGMPGNSRIRVEIEPVAGGAVRESWAYVKGCELAEPAYSDFLAWYQHDYRFIPPGSLEDVVESMIGLSRLSAIKEPIHLSPRYARP
jgi:gamma-glutamylaminecyclotransferase